MATIEDCTTTHKKLAFTLKEQKSQVQFTNLHELEIHEIEVDGCLIPSASESKKCDYLVNIVARDESIFIELKGSDVKHGFEQLQQSHNDLRQHRNRNVIWIVSCQRNPLTSTEVQVKKLEIARKYNSRLYVERSPVEWKLEKP